MSNLPGGLSPLPVTLITGFLGAGKTTLINHLLRACPDRRLGVLVNDFGEVNIDADLIVARSEDVIRLQNGCICCSLRSDLHRQMMQLAESPARPEHLLVEASGVTDPGALLPTLLELERYQILRLDGVIAVADASAPPAPEDAAGQLATRQLAAADVVVLNRRDRASPEAVAAVRAALAKAGRPVVEADGDAVPPELLLGLERDGEPRLPLAPDPAHAEAFSTWRVVQDSPVGFRELVARMRSLPTGILRGKGFVHARERPGDRLAVHLVGDRVQVRTVGRFEGPPRTELVFIGHRGAIAGPDALRAHLFGADDL